FSWLSIDIRLGHERSISEVHPPVEIWTHEVGLRKSLDWSIFSAGLGLRAGASLYHQRSTFFLTPHGEATARLDAQLPKGFIVSAEGGGRLTFLRVDGGVAGP